MKWLEFSVDDADDCDHPQDYYSGCPLCRNEKLQAEIDELVDMLRYYIMLAKMIRDGKATIHEGKELEAMGMVNKHTMEHRVTDKFKECHHCAISPGMPILCSSCLHNRLVIEKQQAEIDELEKKVLQQSKHIARLRKWLQEKE